MATPFYRPAEFQYVGLSQPDMKLVIVLDLPCHRGFPACKLYIPASARLSHGTYSQDPYLHPGTILLGLPYQLQQASQSAGISLAVWDAQALFDDLHRIKERAT